jgi:predicted small lipoprotein YifL
MRRLVLAFAFALGACGGSQPPPPAQPQAPPDTRTPIEKRRDAAAEAIAKRATRCAVDDAHHELEAGKISQKQYDSETGADVQAKLTDDWIHKLEVPLSSFQVRVLEVCNRDATGCDDLNECIQHINDKPK